MKQLLLLFRNKNFNALFWSQLAGVFNDNLFRTAFAAFVAYKLAGMSPSGGSFFVTAALGVYLLPFFIFSIPAGEAADKYDKDTIIKIIKFTEVLTAVLTAIGFYLQSPYFLMGVLFFIGAQSACLGPVRYSIIPQITEQRQIVGANAIIEAGRYISIMLGTLIGALFITKGGLALNIACPIIIGIALLGFGMTFLFSPVKSAATGIRINKDIVRSTLRNIGLVYRSKGVFLCVLAISWFWILGAVLLAQLPDVSAAVLQGDTKVFNYLLIIYALGIGIGSLLCSRLLKGEISIKYVPLSTVLMSIALVDLALLMAFVEPVTGAVSFKSFISTVTGIRASVDFFVIAVCAGMYIVPLNATLQNMCGTRVRSRFIAVSNFLNALFMAAAAGASLILLSNGFGTAAIIGILAVLNLFVALYICILLPGYVLRSVLFFILNTLYKIKTNGMENYHKSTNRTLIIANNNSFLDPLLIAAILPDDIMFVVDSTIAKRFWVRIFLRFVKHIPVDHANPMAVKTIIDEIKKGRKVVIFPEGRISTTGGVMKIYPGPAMIADRAGADILPIFVQGTQYSRLSYYGRKLRHLPDNVEFTVNIMPPVNLDINTELKGKDRRMSAEDKIYDLMTEMKLKSLNSGVTLFRSLIEASDFAGRKRRALEDISRKGISYSTLLTGSFLLGSQFTKFTKEGEYVGIMLPNSNACALAIFGLLAYGRVPAMINFSSGIKNMISATRAGEIKTILCSRLFVARADLKDIISALEAEGVNIVYLEDIKDQITMADKLKALVMGHFPYRAYARTNPNGNPDKPAVLLFTSGSEGTPKGVVLSHRNINYNRNQLLSIVDYGLQDKFFNALPMFHSFGLVCGLFMPLLSGASVFLYPSPLHYKIIPELVYDRNATAIFGTDTFLNAYAKMAHPYDFYSVRFAAVGAEKLKDETFKLWSEKFGIRVLEAYGATEMSPGISFTTPMHFKRGTVGRIFPGLRYKLQEIQGITEGGRLIVKGDNVMLGYLTEENPGKIMPPPDGWYDTGDIVSFDSNGFITIKGRAKRFAKIAGEMVSLTAVESALFNLWPDNMHAVVRLPDPKRGEMLLMYTTKPDADLKLVQDSFRAQGLSDLWVPKKLKIVEALPLMGSGKVDYVKLDEISQSEI